MKVTKAQRRALIGIRDNDRSIRFSVETRWALELQGLIERQGAFGAWVLTAAGREAAAPHHTGRHGRATTTEG